MISRWFVIRGHEPTKIPFKPDEAVAATDACAKAIYGRLFDWIVQRVNESMIIPKVIYLFLSPFFHFLFF